MNAIEIVRTNEEQWKQDFKGKDLSDNQVIEALLKYPKLIQRPIVIDETRGIVGRPVELIENFIK